MIMNVLFINPNRMQPPVAPLALDYIGEALSSRDIRCTALDLCREGPAGLEQILASISDNTTAGNYDAILLTFRNLDDAYYYSQASFLPQMRSLVHSLKKHFSQPVILGGCGFSIAPQELLAYLEADFGITGTAERDLAEFLAALDKRSSIKEIPGLVWKEDKTIHSNSASPPRMDEDFFSPRRFVDNCYYFQKGGQIGLETKRGCSENCCYCADPIAKGNTIYPKPISFLIKEIRSLVDQGINIFHLCDSEFNLPKEQAAAVCTAICDEGLADRIRWFTYASPLGFDEELAFLMAEAGCAGINFGVDHCCPEILSALGRRHRAEDLKQAAMAARQAEISLMFDLLLGGPGETRKTLREVIDFCRDLNVTRTGVNVGMRLYPNTPITKKIIKQGPLKENPDLKGYLDNNEDLLYPLFFVSHLLGQGWEQYLSSLTAGEARFFLPDSGEKESNYNYNENTVLVRAIEKGHRGAFWDILRRVQEDLPPLKV